MAITKFNIRSLGSLLKPCAVRARAWLRHLLAVLMLLLGMELTAAQDVYTPSAVHLTAEAAPTKITDSLLFFLDASGKLTVADIEQMDSSQFSRVDRTPLKLSGGTLWQRFDVVLHHTARPWHLTVPLPALDEATLYFRDNTGQWVQQEAGDTRALSRWALPGRYPVFSLPNDQDVPVRYYLQIRHARIPYSTLPELMADVQLISLRQSEHLLLGIYFGLAMLVVVLASINALAYRDAGFALYAVYVAILSSAQGITTGLAALYIWPESPQLNNMGALLLAALSASSALWFVQTVTRTKQLSSHMGVLMQWLMVANVLSGLINAWVVSPLAFTVYNTLISASIAALALISVL